MPVGARIDRLMRSPAADAVVPGAATAVTLALLLLHRAVSGQPPGEGQSLLLAVLAAGTGGMARLGVWAWRRLWREGVGEWEQVVHGRGVRHFGAAVAVLVPLLTLAGTARDAASAATVADVTIAILRLWTAYVCYFPLALWSGYWWGRVLAQWAGLAPRS